MEKIKCKELYRFPIPTDIISEVFELGELMGKRQQILNWILYNKDLSHELKMSWCRQYSKEFHDKLKPISDRIREKLVLTDLENIITPDIESGEIVVVDITKKEFDTLCKKYRYLCTIDYKDEKAMA